MDLNLDLLTLAGTAARHAGARQAVIAQNVANADTPGYRARDLPAFAEVYGAGTPAPMAMAATRPGHLQPDAGTPLPEPVFAAATGAAQPNGNDVSIEAQMMKSAEARLDHDMALGVLRKSLDILRTSLGRVG